jgi:type I restriction enzyme M protein
VKANLLFFEKGSPTRRIWYYDLSDVKVGKKKPFTREKLADFFRLLPTRGDGDRSWSVDIAARRQAASEEAARIRATAASPRAELMRLEERLAALKDKTQPAETESSRQAIRELQKQIRQIEVRAQAVEDAAFDLKAINPRAQAPEDTRSAAEILPLAESKGREVEASLARLRELLA